MLIITAIPEGEQISEAFSVTLNGRTAELYAVRVSAMPLNRYWPGKQRDIAQTELSSLLTFAADEAVEVCIQAPEAVQKAVIRPLSKNVRCTVEEQNIRFTLTQKGQYVVEINDAHHVLHIFYDSIEDFSAASGDTVIRYGAGIHNIGYVELKDNTTVLIDRDAVVYGAFYGMGAKNIRILGHGIIDGSFDERHDSNTLLVYDFTRCADNSWEKEKMRQIGKFTDAAETPPKITCADRYGSYLYRDRESFLQWMRYMDAVRSGTHFYACENVEIRGVTYRNSAGLTLTSASCSHMIFDNIKHIGMWRYNSDGIDFYNCRDCVVRNCFMRNFDDCICVKGQVGWDTENSEDILVENCVVWADWGKSLEIGVDTVAPEIKNITYRNCDCIHHHAPVIDIFCDDRAKISDILFSDIRIEYSSYDTGCQYQYNEDDVYQDDNILHPFIMVGVGGCNWSNDGVIGDVSKVTFENISVVCEDGESIPPVVISGRDSEHKVESVVLQNVTVNGKPLNEAHISKNEYVGEVLVNKNIAENTVSAENQIKKSQSTYYIGNPNAAYRIAVVGNSITLHGICEEIGWTRLCGMAASDAEHDYVHLLYNLCCKGGKECYMMVNQLSYWEMHYRDNILENYTDIREFNPDILVFRLGENVNGDITETEWEQQVNDLLSTICAEQTKVVMTTCFWDKPSVDVGIRRISAQNKYKLVELGDLGSRDDMKALGLFTHAGVASHPGDVGMKTIAERINKAVIEL